ncbi:hypothetical protein JOC55_000906 [Paenibacillus sacheonensis]|nr:hypothetical protein [Paenibacillus sacheonensis]
MPPCSFGCLNNRLRQSAVQLSAKLPVCGLSTYFRSLFVAKDWDRIPVHNEPLLG